ncbi:hypothetical protein LG293_17560 (plasmid) [Citricoccus nitrophenolicus]
MNALTVYVVHPDEPIEVELDEYGDGSKTTTVSLRATDQRFTLAGHVDASGFRPATV